MSDIFIEQLVKQQDSMKTKLYKALIIFVAAVVIIIGAPFIMSQFGSIALLIICGVGYIGWILFTSLSLEYEYIYTNGEIDVDRISAKRKRKRVTTVKITSFDCFEAYDHEKYKAKTFDVRIMACTDVADENTYCATYQGKESKRCLLVFTPNEALLTAISTISKRKRV